MDGKFHGEKMLKMLGWVLSLRENDTEFRVENFPVHVYTRKIR